MKLTTSIVSAAALLAIGIGAPAVQATASPAGPASATPTASTSGASGKVAKARIIWFYTALTDVQRRCLADAGLQRPEGKLTEAQRKALQQQIHKALTACDVKLPGRLADRERLGFGWASLTSDQQHCLANAALMRPVGRLTAAERAAIRKEKLDAAAACGVQV
jgi:hypothetical protein